MKRISFFTYLTSWRILEHGWAAETQSEGTGTVRLSPTLAGGRAAAVPLYPGPKHAWFGTMLGSPGLFMVSALISLPMESSSMSGIGPTSLCKHLCYLYREILLLQTDRG